MGLIRFIIIIGITTFTYFTFSQTLNKKENSSVKLELDKTEYVQGDTIKLRITNLSKDTFQIAHIYFSSDCIKLKKKKEDIWEQLIIQGFSGGMRTNTRQDFLPGEVINFNWNQKYLSPTDEIPSNREFVPNGTYIFEFHFTTLRKNPNSRIESYVTYSEEFEIK